MADEEQKPDGAVVSKEPAVWKVGLIIVAILGLQVGGIFLFTKFIGSDPAAKGAAEDANEDKGPGLGLKNLEIIVAEGQFENYVTGERVLYKVRVVAKISRTKGEEKKRFETEEEMKTFEEELKGLDGEFREAISSIIRREQPSSLRQDHDLGQLRSKIKDKLNKIIKMNTETNENLIHSVIIPEFIETHRS
jgi:flagellar basal body-associated protein FliL